MIVGDIKLPMMKGLYVRSNIELLEEPCPIEGTDKLRCLANVNGALCVIELRLKFAASPKKEPS